MLCHFNNHPNFKIHQLDNVKLISSLDHQEIMNPAL